jgi:hypothetical protein
MNDRHAISSAVAFVAALFFASAEAAAPPSLFRAYLSSTGSDANPCTLPAPCRLLPAAIAVVVDGGEIWMLDSANYNTATVNITRSLSILAIPGEVGSVLSLGGPAILINTAGVKVALRNLVIVPFPGGGGTDGIVVQSASKLTVEDSLISGHTGNGISIQSQTAVRITNCIIRDNGNNGMLIQGGATADISSSKLLSNGSIALLVFGDVVSLTTSAAISDSVLSGNTGSGMQVGADGSIAAAARASITRSTVSDNVSSGVVAFTTGGAAATSILTIGSNMITGNQIGLDQLGTGAVLETLGNNIVRQNPIPTLGTITTVAPM